MLIIGCEQKVEQTLKKENIITDDLGYEHSFDQVPTKVITLAPNLTEMIFELELGNNLIGNTTYCNYPPAADSIKKVGDMLSINHELLIQLKPDIILITVEGNTKETFDKIKSLGLKVFISNPRTYDGIKKTFSDLAKIFDKEKLAEQKIKLWDEQVDTIKTLSAMRDTRLAMFLVSLQPIMAAGQNTFINEFLQFCNLKNIASDQEVNYPFFSREEILKRNPEVILHTEHNYIENVAVTELYKEWRNVNALMNKRIFYLNPDLYFRPGPRFAEALTQLNDLLGQN
jgi:iron complex transport system substrate-binding protein